MHFHEQMNAFPSQVSFTNQNNAMFIHELRCELFVENQTADIEYS